MHLILRIRISGWSPGIFMLSSYPSNSDMHQSLTTTSKGTLTNELMSDTKLYCLLGTVHPSPNPRQIFYKQANLPRFLLPILNLVRKKKKTFQFHCDQNNSRRPRKYFCCWEILVWIFSILHCQGTFNFKGSTMLFSSFMCHFSRTLYSLSVPGKQERADLHAVLRTEIMRKGTCLDSFQWLPSVTPSSDLLFKGSLFSYASLTQDMEYFLALWRLLFAWLCFCSIFLLPKAALYEDIWTCGFCK